MLVLDTNIVRSAGASALEALAKQGHRLRIAEGCYLEWCAQGARMLSESRPRARGLFFSRARQIAPFLDQQTPIAVSAGLLLRKVKAEADGQPVPDAFVERERLLTEQWALICGTGITDETWTDWASIAEEHLDSLDAGLMGLALRGPELDKKVSEDMKATNDMWNAMSDAEQMPILCQYVKETVGLSDAAAERLDAQTRTFSLRLQAAARGRRLPKRNDGADLSHTMFPADGCFLVTDDGSLIDIVDESGTYQAPWVRRFDDLDDLPTGEPWGENAREIHRAFVRTK